MATKATVTVPADTFPLGTVFETLPGVEGEIERIVPGVKDLRLIDSVQDEYLLRVEWEPEYVETETTGVQLAGRAENAAQFHW